MKHAASETIEAGSIVPVFPLPNTVFFPHTSLPLHVFEPRYRAMVRDATAGAGLLVVALAVGEDFESLGSVGRIHDLQPLDDGRCLLRLEGLQRIRATEVPCDTPYRQVRIEPRPERVGAEDRQQIDQAKLELLAQLGLLRSMAQTTAPVVLHQHLPFEVVVNTACAGLPIEPAARQQLLAEDDLLRRQRAVSGCLGAVLDALSSWKAEGRLDRSDLN